MIITDTQQVCLNGDQITDSYESEPENRRAYCPQCGEATINQCPSCNAPILGLRYNEDGPVDNYADVPSHCHGCGKAYPWAKIDQKSAVPEAKQESANPLSLIDLICSRFHLVAKQLQKRHENRQTLNFSDEYDVQDLMHALLNIYFNDIRKEEGTPSFAGKSARMDFLLKEYGVVIEVKKTRDGLGAKELGAQLIDDIARYKSHPDCKILFCFVYDPEGRVTNPRGIERDLSRIEDNLTVKVVIVPKGI